MPNDVGTGGRADFSDAARQVLGESAELRWREAASRVPWGRTELPTARLTNDQQAALFTDLRATNVWYMTWGAVWDRVHRTFQVQLGHDELARLRDAWQAHHDQTSAGSLTSRTARVSASMWASNNTDALKLYRGMHVRRWALSGKSFAHYLREEGGRNFTYQALINWVDGDNTRTGLTPREQALANKVRHRPDGLTRLERAELEGYTKTAAEMAARLGVDLQVPPPRSDRGSVAAQASVSSPAAAATTANPAVPSTVVPMAGPSRSSADGNRYHPPITPSSGPALSDPGTGHRASATPAPGPSIRGHHRHILSATTASVPLRGPAGRHDAGTEDLAGPLSAPYTGPVASPDDPRAPGTQSSTSSFPVGFAGPSTGRTGPTADLEATPPVPAEQPRAAQAGSSQSSWTPDVQSAFDAFIDERGPLPMLGPVAVEDRTGRQPFAIGSVPRHAAAVAAAATSYPSAVAHRTSASDASTSSAHPTSSRMWTPTAPGRTRR